MLGRLVYGTLNESEMRVVLFTNLVFHSSAYFPQQANCTVGVVQAAFERGKIYQVVKEFFISDLLGRNLEFRSK